MNFKLQKRILFLGTILAFIITTSVFTFFLHRNHEETRTNMIENKLKGDARSILPHLYQSGNFAWFNANLEEFKQLGLTCLNVRDNTGKVIWGNTESCKKFITAKNYVDQKVLEIHYSLPQGTVLSTIKEDSVGFFIFFSFQVLFLFISYMIFSSINKKHMEVLLQNEQMKGINDTNERILKLTRTLSHNLKSPLAALKTLYDLASSKLDHDEKILLTSIQKNIDSMANRLVQQDETNAPTNLTDLSKVITNAVKMKSREYQPHDNLVLKMQISSNLHGMVNDSELTNIISNIVNNSIEGKKEKIPLTVTISCYAEDETIKIDIEDDGKGISSKNIQDIFKFGVTTKINGQGCGLYHAKKVIENWNGKITIESKENEFTKVQIELPLNNLTPPEEIVFIDNEQLNLLSWKGMALKKGVRFKGYLSPNEFQKVSSSYSEETHIYIDYDLGLEKSTGLDIARDLRQQGFKNIYLATGHAEKISDEFMQVSKVFPL